MNTFGFGFIISCLEWETKIVFPAFNNITMKLPDVSKSKRQPLSWLFFTLHQHMHKKVSQFEPFLLSMKLSQMFTSVLLV